MFFQQTNINLKRNNMKTSFLLLLLTLANYVLCAQTPNEQKLNFRNYSNQSFIDFSIKQASFIPKIYNLSLLNKKNSNQVFSYSKDTYFEYGKTSYIMQPTIHGSIYPMATMSEGLGYAAMALIYTEFFWKK